MPRPADSYRRDHCSDPLAAQAGLASALVRRYSHARPDQRMGSICKGNDITLCEVQKESEDSLLCFPYPG